MKNGLRLIDEIVHDKEITSCAHFGDNVAAVHTKFIKVTVSNFMITSIDADHCCFNRCDLNGVQINNGSIRRCAFSNVHFNCVTFADILFEECVFERCSFRDIRFGLRGNWFAKCQFSYCDLPKDDSAFFYLTLADRRCIGGANIFSQCTGWASPSEFLARNFERNENNTGYIVYKTFGHLYSPPKEWVITPGSIITENCDLNRMETCSYGINVATLEWIRNNIDGAYGRIPLECKSTCSIWRCEILDEWLADVCVPIGSDGKIRCGKLRLIETI